MNLHLYTGDSCPEIRAITRREGGPWCDCTVTSPPYNIGMKYADGVKDNLKEEDYETFSLCWLHAVLEATHPKGHLFLNVGGISSQPLLPMQVLNYATRAGWHLQNTFHWIKSISFPGKDGVWVSRGQFKPINSERFVNNIQEYVFHLTPENRSPLDKLAVGVPYQDKTNVDRWAGKRDKRCRGNVWFLPYATIQSSAKQRPHPATFPVELAEMCLKIAGRPKVVMDPFVGSGSTGVAAQDNGAADFYGIDLSPTYIKATRERLTNLKKP